MNINGREYSEPETLAYIKELEAEIKKLNEDIDDHKHVNNALHMMLRKYGKKYYKAIELLKAADEGFRFLGSWMADLYICKSYCSDCPLHRPGSCLAWKYTEEVKKLIER